MAFRRDTTTHDRGAGLARGPAYIIGTILAAFGLILLLSSGDAPINFATDGFPDADASGEKFLGFEWNGWTAWITITAGVLLIFGAAQHALAKGFSLVVGLVLGAFALIGSSTVTYWAWPPPTGRLSWAGGSLPYSWCSTSWHRGLAETSTAIERSSTATAMASTTAASIELQQSTEIGMASTTAKSGP